MSDTDKAQRMKRVQKRIQEEQLIVLNDVIAGLILALRVCHVDSETIDALCREYGLDMIVWRNGRRS